MTAPSQLAPNHEANDRDTRRAGRFGSVVLWAILGGLLVSLQSLPSICWLSMAVLWFGWSEKAILFVVIMGSVLSVT